MAQKKNRGSPPCDEICQYKYAFRSFVFISLICLADLLDWMNQLLLNQQPNPALANVM